MGDKVLSGFKKMWTTPKENPICPKCGSNAEPSGRDSMPPWYYCENCNYHWNELKEITELYREDVHNIKTK